MWQAIKSVLFNIVMAIVFMVLALVEAFSGNFVGFTIYGAWIMMCLLHGMTRLQDRQMDILRERMDRLEFRGKRR